MVAKSILFGYEVGSGKPVHVPLAHTVITGLTHESGKTTATMGLIKRSGLKAVIFKTKIGEKAITEGAVIPPFYREDFDWEYAAELLESSRKEKLKFERSWIIKYSKGATNLLGFKRNIDTALTEGKIRELDKSVLITLQAYLDKILPELQYAPLSKTLDILEGINIMDLERFKEETQALIIRSVLNEVLKEEKKVITVIPECWKYMPERIASPVKRPAEALIRQGATNDNYVWMDSQDITGVAKVILKQVSNWILGYQREINEINRTLDQIPLPAKSKPKAEDVATLKTGQFIVATSEGVFKAYAQPAWMAAETAVKIARGELDVSQIEMPLHIAPYEIAPYVAKEPVKDLQTPLPDFDRKIRELHEDFISNRADFFAKFEELNESMSKIRAELFRMQQAPKIDEDEVMMRVLQKIPLKSSGSNINKDELVAEIISKIPKIAGSVTYTVAPLEKIQKDFLEEAKQKVLLDIESLSDNAKRMLKYLEARNQGVKSLELEEKCFFMSHSGASAKKVSEASLELRAVKVADKDTAGWHRTKLKARITEMLSLHSATEQEIEQVYNHVLNELV